MTNNILASLISGSGIPVKRHGVSGFPASGGAVTPIDDTSLMAYWKFNEASGNIINQSESDETLGSSADLTPSGITYGVTGTPDDLGDAVTFDGSNDYAVAGTSKSQFNFMHNQSGLFTVNFWLMYLGTISEEYIFDTVFTEGTQVGFYVRTKAKPNGLEFRVVRGEDFTRVIVLTTTANFIPDKDEWHMYTLKYDYSGSSPQATILRDNANSETATITSDAASNSNSTYAMQIARRDNGNGGAQFGNFQACEWSVWNRVLSDEEITALYNDGAGREIY